MTRSRALLITGGYFATFIALGLISGVMGPALPSLAAQTHASLGQISAVFIARSAGYMAGALTSGRFYDGGAGHRLMALALLGSAVALAFMPLAGQLWLLLGLLFILGLAEGGMDVGGNSLLQWLHGDRVAPYLNGLHFFFGVGALVAPLWFAWLGNLRFTLWLCGLLAVPIAVWMLTLPTPVSPHSETPHTSATRRGVVWLFVGLFLLYVGAEASYGSWIFTYAVRQFASPEAQAAYLTSAFWAAFTVGRMFSVPLATRFSPGALIVSGLLMALTGVASISVFGQSTAALWAGTLGVGIGLAPVFAALLALAAKRMPITGAATGWFLVGAACGTMIVPWLIGQFVETAGAWVIMAAIGAALALMLLFVFIPWKFLPSEKIALS